MRPASTIPVRGTSAPAPCVSGDAPADAAAARLRDTLQRFGGSGPRYTSYPTADRFTEAITAEDYIRQLRAVATRTAAPGAAPLSLYFHLPFCAHLCWYCGCNKVVTRDHGRSAKYIRYLDREMALVTEATGRGLPVGQLHWGGGTPTFLSHEEMRDLMRRTRQYFDLQADGEYAIEIDPRAVQDDTVAVLAELGFNRFSLGVQDVDPAVQEAIHRVQPVSQTRAVIDAARRHGIRSINLDLICGLPLQTLASFDATLRTVIDMAPERIAIYGYAHLPHLFKPQRRIDEDALPTASEKLDMMLLAGERLAAAGYIDIGMDHYARPDDDLARAQAEGRLHRNFQGYSTQAQSDLLAFGISAIGKPGEAFVQNVRTLDDYYTALDARRFPVLRGHHLTKEDHRRAEIIQALMCHFTFDIPAFEARHQIDFQHAYAGALAQLVPLQAAGLVTVDATRIGVTPLGRHLVRRVAMAFDAYLAAEPVGDGRTNDRADRHPEGCGTSRAIPIQPLRYSRIL
ncbi:oxygen-independent coproporphyrinogen III oxidase [Imbroritus primus]|uniref:oxygen-independent coproporphyrinogen III oxidase n=1 Tax=Imbroritus primus TaxID=3058603 RepID=UPI003D161B2D